MLLLTHWRGIFIVLMLYGVVAFVWSALRMPETLPEARRKSLAIGEVLGAYRQTVTDPQTLGYALVAGGDVFDFVRSPVDDTVAYIADQQVDQRSELYIVPAAGGWFRGDISLGGRPVRVLDPEALGARP